MLFLELVSCLQIQVPAPTTATLLGSDSHTLHCQTPKKKSEIKTVQTLADIAFKELYFQLTEFPNDYLHIIRLFKQNILSLFLIHS